MWDTTSLIVEPWDIFSFLPCGSSDDVSTSSTSQVVTSIAHTDTSTWEQWCLGSGLYLEQEDCNNNNNSCWRGSISSFNARINSHISKRLWPLCHQLHWHGWATKMVLVMLPMLLPAAVTSGSSQPMTPEQSYKVDIPGQPYAHNLTKPWFPAFIPPVFSLDGYNHTYATFCHLWAWNSIETGGWDALAGTSTPHLSKQRTENEEELLRWIE
jgi:hypothetical protein